MCYFILSCFMYSIIIEEFFSFAWILIILMNYSSFECILFFFTKLKYCQYFTVNGVWRYFRSCAYMGEPGIKGDERFCLMRTGSYNIFIEYCTCNSKDGCNAATIQGLTKYLLALPVTFILKRLLF